MSIDLTTRRVHSQYRSDHDIELPRINERDCYLRPYRYVYGISTGPNATHAVADRLVKIDNDSGSAAVWSEDGSYPGEPVFVAAPTARSEDHGVALSVVLDAAHGRSYLLVLDAESWNELARIEAPHAIPHGIHGAFYPGQ